MKKAAAARVRRPVVRKVAAKETQTFEAVTANAKADVVPEAAAGLNA